MLKKFYMALITILCSLGITIAISYAWFLNDTNVDPIAQGMAGTAYFAYGDGSSDKKPYGINTPRHLYNLAWLCYLYPGQYADKYYEIDPSLKGELKMDGWTLPPIGKDDSPFTGFFNGNGKTIKNLTVSNDTSSMSIKPNNIPSNEFDENDEKKEKLVNAKSIGFFGNISGNGTKQVYDFYLDNAKIETKTSSTCAGIVAGYVDGKIENVGVINSGLDLGASSHGALTSYTNNVSDYTVVGYAEDEYTTSAAGRHTIIYNPYTNYSYFNFRGMGSGDSWGGSVDFTKMWNRIQDVVPMNTSYQISTFTDSEIEYKNISKQSVTTTLNVSNSPYLTTSSKTRIKNELGGANGTYLREYDSGDDYANCLTNLYKDVLIVSKDNTITNGGFKIRTSDAKYLNIYSQYIQNTLTFNVGISSGTSAVDATVWAEQAVGNKVYLYTYNVDDGFKYYLSVDSSNNLILLDEDNNNNTAWEWSNVLNTYTYTDASSNPHYLNCVNVNNTWTWTLAGAYVITNDDGTTATPHYIKRSGTQIMDTTDLSQATKWVFSINGVNPSGTIYDSSDTSYKLNINNTSLNASTNSTTTTWNNDGSNIFSGTNVIKFDGTNWVVEAQNTFKIQYNGGHYLKYNGSLGDAPTANNGTDFSLSGTLQNATGSGQISFTYDNQTYYLRYNNGLTITQDQDASNTTWSRDQYGIYITVGNVNQYIQYDNGWKAQKMAQSQETGYYIRNNSYYLSVKDGAIYLDDGQSYPTYWFFTDMSNTSKPSGYLYTYVDGNIQYLNLSTSRGTNSSLSSVPHTFTWPSNNRLYDNDVSRYLYWYRGVWSGYRSGDSITVDIQTINIDEPGSTPFASFGVYTGYISKAKIVSVGIDKSQTGDLDVYSRTWKLRQASEFGYIPLTTKGDKEATMPSNYQSGTSQYKYYDVDDSNTGYITSGGYEPQFNLDTRISRYDIDNISSGYSNGQWVDSGKGILTVGKNGASTSYYVGSTQYPTSLFQNFETSKANFLTTLKKDNSYVYGLHFMPADITKNHLLTLPAVTINENTYTNYQMPEDCIDFTLKAKGFITFYAGYYFTGGSGSPYPNNSFFSLNEIMRDKNDNRIITQIRHILKVYNYTTLNGNYYVYYYEDVDNTSEKGYYYYDPELEDYVTLTGSEVSESDLLFDKQWIEQPGCSIDTYMNYIFYFEVPVNHGEFALGSVSGGIGAYLLYLDIGANAAYVDRTEITQEIDNVTYTYKYVNGIQVLNSSEIGNATINGKNSVSVIVEPSITGTVVLNKPSENTIYIKDGFSDTSLNKNLKASYQGDGIATFNGDLSDVPKDTIRTKQLKIIDYKEGSVYRTTIKKVGGTITESSVHKIDTSSLATNLNLYDESINKIPETTVYGLLRIGTQTDNTSKGYGIECTAEELLNSVTFRNADNDDKLIEYSCKLNPKTQENLNAINEVITTNVSEVTDKRKINNHQINAGTNKITIDGYTLQHVYRLTGDTITISSTALATIINGNVKVLVYVPTLVEQTGDENPQYVFVINGTNVTEVNQTFAVTNGA